MGENPSHGGDLAEPWSYCRAGTSTSGVPWGPAWQRGWLGIVWGDRTHIKNNSNNPVEEPQGVMCEPLGSHVSRCPRSQRTPGGGLGWASHQQEGGGVAKKHGDTAGVHVSASSLLAHATKPQAIQGKAEMKSVLWWVGRLEEVMSNHGM